MSGRLPIGVLVMAYGGPASLDEIPGYLADIRHGRPTPRAVLEEITENYRSIGGSSPLLGVTRSQVDALQAELGDDYRCYLGMRHWSPWIEDVVGEMAEQGVTHAVSLVLASRGYPESSSRGDVIEGVEAAAATGAEVTHAGTAIEDGRLVTAGGRVLNVTALGADVATARERAYDAAELITFGGRQIRTDIAARAVERTTQEA